MTKKQMTEQEFHELIYDALNFEDEGEVYTMTIERLNALCEREEPDEESVRYAREVAAELARESEMETAADLAKESEIEADKMSEMKADKTFNMEFGEMFEPEFDKILGPKFSKVSEPEFSLVSEHELDNMSEPEFESTPLKKSFFTNPRTKRIIGIAAAFLLVVAIVASVASPLTPRVDADKDKEKTMQLQGETQVQQGTVFEGEEALGYKVWEKDKWENVPDAVKFVPELLIPCYIPDDFEFERLNIKKYEDNLYMAEYRFLNGTGSLYIFQSPFPETKDEVLLLEDYDELIETNKGDLQILLSDKGEPQGVIVFSGIKVKIQGCSSAEEMKRIVDGLE